MKLLYILGIAFLCSTHTELFAASFEPSRKRRRKDGTLTLLPGIDSKRTCYKGGKEGDLSGDEADSDESEDNSAVAQASQALDDMPRRRIVFLHPPKRGVGLGISVVKPVQSRNNDRLAFAVVAEECSLRPSVLSGVQGLGLKMAATSGHHSPTVEDAERSFRGLSLRSSKTVTHNLCNLRGQMPK